MKGKEKPIIFSTEMVRAIIGGGKTQTRRVMKPAFRNYRGFKQGDGLWVDGYGWESKPNGHIKDYSVTSAWIPKGKYIEEFAPYKPGDILWVRETWFKNAPEGPTKYFYRADEQPEEVISQMKAFGYKWKPAIYMPREAARLFLKVIDVRVERLQEITEEDAMSEGVKDPYEYQEPVYYEQPHMRGLEINKSAFAGLWDSINAKRGYNWDVNPWVWVVEFERMEEKQNG